MGPIRDLRQQEVLGGFSERREAAGSGSWVLLEVSSSRKWFLGPIRGLSSRKWFMGSIAGPKQQEVVRGSYKRSQAAGEGSWLL